VLDDDESQTNRQSRIRATIDARPSTDLAAGRPFVCAPVVPLLTFRLVPTFPPLLPALTFDFRSAPSDKPVELLRMVSPTRVRFALITRRSARGVIVGRPSGWRRTVVVLHWGSLNDQVGDLRVAMEVCVRQMAHPGLQHGPGDGEFQEARSTAGSESLPKRDSQADGASPTRSCRASLHVRMAGQHGDRAPAGQLGFRRPRADGIAQSGAWPRTDASPPPINRSLRAWPTGDARTAR